MSAVKEENVKRDRGTGRRTLQIRNKEEKKEYRKNAPLDFAKGKDSGVFRSPFGKKILWSSEGEQDRPAVGQKSRGLNFAKACGRLFVSETASGF